MVGVIITTESFIDRKAFIEEFYHCAYVGN